MSLTTIRLYGPLGSRFGRVHRMDVSSLAEAIRALGSQLKGFSEYLTGSKDRGIGYTVFYDKKNLREDQLQVPVGKSEIRIAPVIIGAKRGGIFQIILGAVLVVAGFFLMGTPFGMPLIKLGAGLILGGIAQLLMPAPKGSSSKDKPENTPSYAFNGPINTQAQGNCVPVLYGELIVGSAVISAGISAVDHAIIPEDSGGGGSKGAPDDGGSAGGGMNEYINEWDAV